VGELLRRAYAPISAVSKALRGETSVAWKGIREGVYRTIGTALITGAATDISGVTKFSGVFIEFVLRHSKELVTYVSATFENETLVEIVNWIVRLGS
jgi:hypothetical protein